MRCLFALTLVLGCVERAPVLSTRDAATAPDAAARDFGTRDDAAVPAIGGRRTVAAATAHSCAVGLDGLYCWGSDGDGRLGNGAGGASSTPVRVSGDGEFVSVVALNDHTCALDVTGTVYCWGANGDGQLGLGDREPRDAPVAVAIDEPLVEVDVGQAHTCAVGLSGALWCWGRNSEGQLGGEASGADASDVPLRVGSSTDWKHVSTGQGHTCGLRLGGLWCWGRNSSFQLGLGLGAPMQRRTPTEVSGETQLRWQEVAAGQNSSCGLAEEGTLYCWGDNNSYQLGTGDLTAEPSPTAVDPGPWQQLDTDTFHGCATAAGVIACWGRNAEGQLGVGDLEDRPTPTLLSPSPGGEWSEVSTGRFHTCARDVGGDVYCMGANEGGKLGTGDESRRREPTLVLRIRPG